MQYRIRKRSPSVTFSRSSAFKSSGSRSIYMRQEETSCAVCISCTCIYRVNNIIIFERILASQFQRHARLGESVVLGFSARTLFSNIYFISLSFKSLDTRIISLTFTNLSIEIQERNLSLDIFLKLCCYIRRFYLIFPSESTTVCMCVITFGRCAKHVYMELFKRERERERKKKISM